MTHHYQVLFVDDNVLTENKSSKIITELVLGSSSEEVILNYTSSSIFHGVGPLVDPFRSHVSRSLNYT
jgi:hypothetical protein